VTKTRSFAVSCLFFALIAAALAPAANAGGGIGRLLAPATACPHQNQPTAPSAQQIRAMRCMTNYARTHSGLEPLTGSKPLFQAADRKAADIVRCDEFSHEACGREFTYWMKHFGYISGDCWTAAENIAWGTGPIGSARAIFGAWLRSPGHRENILGPYAEIGIGLRIGSIEGSSGAHIWVQEFGSHHC
jgi:uncharacterized protein YkwD